MKEDRLAQLVMWAVWVVVVTGLLAIGAMVATVILTIRG